MEWKVRKGDEVFTCADISTLKRWAEEGRIQQEDYVFNPVLEQWLYARDVAEVQGCFVKKGKSSEANRLNTLGLVFGVSGLLLALVVPPLGGALFLLGKPPALPGWQ